ncbi:hypothetical protein Cgig2_000947 [Carnegiea gigantea]|uniref:Uncharacterized protein n=1 Tax=Carnegiea gigantea TaxID=171969 RepID=A0A9Q1GMK5_9CARY|nr:hypothetical protein Cgig2_000947 [Carnegiea gigantea]
MIQCNSKNRTKQPINESKKVRTVELYKHHRKLQNEVTYVTESSFSSDDDGNAFDTLNEDMDNSPNSLLVSLEGEIPDMKLFKIGHREVPFPLYDVALLIGLPATREHVTSEHGQGTCESDKTSTLPLIAHTKVDDDVFYDQQNDNDQQADRIDGNVSSISDCNVQLAYDVAEEGTCSQMHEPGEGNNSTIGKRMQRSPQQWNLSAMQTSPYFNIDNALRMGKHKKRIVYIS